MSDRFQPYLEEIELTKGQIEKILESLEFNKDLISEAIEDIFLEDRLIGEEREFFSLHLFSKKFDVEIQNIFKDESTTLVHPLKGKYDYFLINRSRYNFKQTTSKSTLEISYTISMALQGFFVASGKNCKYLYDIYKKYLLPNMSYIS